MAELFAEQPAAVMAWPGGWDFEAPRIQSGRDGQDDLEIDMMLRTGLRVPPGPACPGRPLSEQAINTLATALDKSLLASTLCALTGLTSTGIFNFHRRGLPNTSGTATLVWQIASGEIPPFQITVRVEVPGQDGHSDVQMLNISVDVVSRLSSWMRAKGSPPLTPPGGLRRLEPAEWATLLDAMMATLTEPGVVAVIADLADVDPILVPLPRVLHVVSGPEIARFLPPQLQPIAGVTSSHGAHLQADPVLSLADSDDRARQVTRWLCQIAADAGLTGMERLVTPLQPPDGLASED